MSQYRSPLHETVSTTMTDYWNDSCSIEELTYALEHGAVGATTNPTIVLQVLNKEMRLWRGRIFELIEEHSDWDEEKLAWKLFEEVSIEGSKLLLPVFEREIGLKGRLSIQTHPAFYRNWQAIAEHAEHYNRLAPNMQVKIPATKAGITALEEATYRGININATVNFTVPQAIAVAEAVERGLNRREAEGKPIADMTPVCTIMVGRLDDWIQVLAKRDGIIVNPGYMHWAGVAAFKRAYSIFKERGFRARLLAAAYRHHLHWSEFIGGDVILTIPYEWQKRFNASDVEVKPRMDRPVNESIIDSLYTHFPDFRRAYDPEGMTIDEFDSYGATIRTLRGFINSVHDLVGMVRDHMLPNPDVNPAVSD